MPGYCHRYHNRETCWLNEWLAFDFTVKEDLYTAVLWKETKNKWMWERGK